MKRLLALLLAVPAVAVAGTEPVPAPADDALPALAAALHARLEGKTLPAPGGVEVAVGTILDAGRTETCLRTIAKGGGWPSSWLIVSDQTQPYDLVLRIVLQPDGTIADPETAFLTERRPWDDDAFDAAFKAATGKKPPREKSRNVVVQSFTTRVVTEYVYALPAAGAAAKGLLALLPEGSLIREAQAVDLRDGKRHTMAVILDKPRFVPADCATEEGRARGHRDLGGVKIVLAGEKALEDTMDITDLLTGAAGDSSVPRFACRPEDTEPGTIEALVANKLEGREAVRLLDLGGRTAETRLDGLPVVVGVTKKDGAFKLFARAE